MVLSLLLLVTSLTSPIPLLPVRLCPVLSPAEGLHHLSFLLPTLHMLSCVSRAGSGLFVSICWSGNGFVSLITEQTPAKTSGDVLIKVPISALHLFDLVLLGLGKGAELAVSDVVIMR